ncbi:hypothetical protein ACFLSJ_03385 [Verrucomicrobiota bacterium]
MIAREIERSADAAEAIDRFLQELRTWIYDCLDTYGESGPTGGHDQLTYTTGWAPYLDVHPDRPVVNFLVRARDDVAKHCESSGLWRHGYWKQQEAHHGTEHYDIFLRFLADVEPEDGETARQLLDAAEHMGNWVPGIPDWYDYDTGLFRSFWFGTEQVGRDGDDGINVPDHFRCVNLCLLAHRVSGQGRYLALAGEYGGRWAEAILQSKSLPLGLAPSGPVYDCEGGTGLSTTGPARGDNLLKAELFLASNATNAFLDLWVLTADGRFLEAEERLLDVLCEGLSDPDAGIVADAIRRYRSITGKSGYDDRIMALCEAFRVEDIGTIGMEPNVERSAPHRGVGKRPDTADWFEDGLPRKINPILLSAAAEISGDTGLAVMALDMARTYFILAREVYPDGREHGCSARSVSAIARGHGRDNHAGVTTAVLRPIVTAFGTTMHSTG